MANRWENNGNSERLYFGVSKITADGDCSHDIRRCLLLGRKVMINLESTLKSRDNTLSTKVHLVRSYGFSSSHVWIWELDYKESWAPKNWCFELWCWRRLSRVPWTARRSNQSILEEISPGCSLEGLMKLKLPVLWLPDVKNSIMWKGPDAGKEWWQEEKGRIEDEMVGWYHQLDGHGFVWTPGVGDGQGKENLD